VTTNLRLVLNDDQLRRIRAGAYKRGGPATRKEVQMWVTLLVGRALQQAPDPITRRKRPPTTAPLADAETGQPVVAEVTDETVCRHCGRARERHGKMLQTCLPGFGAPPGARFAPAA
jgi:hypothetical protein